MVVTRLAPAAFTRVTHERIGCPSRCTVHAPHRAMPQPNLVPVRPSASRSTHNNGVSSSTWTLCTLPFTVIEDVITPPRRARQRRRPSQHDTAIDQNFGSVDVTGGIGCQKRHE